MTMRAARMPDLNQFIEDRASTFRSAAGKPDIDLRLSLDPRGANADLYLDREKFDKLLFNLLSNAYKFTRQGSIEIRTEFAETTFRLWAMDTGIGIKEDQLPYIFDRFRQADASASREFGGTGLGLALVKEVAKLHGGDVIVYSQFGKGSTFEVTLPLGTAHLQPQEVVDFVDDLIGHAADLLLQFLRGPSVQNN
jgi:signal transduction histidine kinase